MWVSDETDKLSYAARTEYLESNTVTGGNFNTDANLSTAGSLSLSGSLSLNHNGPPSTNSSWFNFRSLLSTPLKLLTSGCDRLS